MILLTLFNFYVDRENLIPLEANKVIIGDVFYNYQRLKEALPCVFPQKGSEFAEVLRPRMQSEKEDPIPPDTVG